MNSNSLDRKLAQEVLRTGKPYLDLRHIMRDINFPVYPLKWKPR